MRYSRPGCRSGSESSSAPSWAGSSASSSGCWSCGFRAAYLALFTLGFAEILKATISAEIEITRGQAGMELPALFESGVTLFGHTFDKTDKLPPYFVMFGLLLVCLAILAWLAGSKFGLFVRALREDQDAAAALGVNTTRYKVLVFVVTTMMAASAGAVQAHYVGIVTPNNLFLLQMSLVVAMAVIGGVESFIAAAIGAVLIEVALEMLRNSFVIGGVEIDMTIWRLVFFGIVLMLTLRFARNGLIAPPHRVFHPWTRRAGDGRASPPSPRGGGGGEVIHLAVSNVHKRFGGLHALKGVTFEVNGPELIGLIGPQRGGQDDPHQRPRRGDQAEHGHRVPERPAHRSASSLRGGDRGTRPHLPGDAILPAHERPREPLRAGARHAAGRRPEGHPREGDGGAGVPDPGAPPQRVRPGALRGAAEAAGARPAPDARPRDRDPRRAFRGGASAAHGDHLRLHPAGERGGQGNHPHSRTRWTPSSASASGCWC